MYNNVPHHQYADGPNPKIYSTSQNGKGDPEKPYSARPLISAFSSLMMLICLTVSKYSNEMLRI